MTRIATAADAQEVGALLHAFHVEYEEASPGPETLAERVGKHIEAGLSTFVLAGPEGVGVGQLRFREYLFTGLPTCYLEELYVVSGHRGEGHGRALMETAIAHARGRGATYMELGTAVDDTAARGLYESMGFTNLEREGRPESQMLYYEREL